MLECPRCKSEHIFRGQCINCGQNLSEEYSAPFQADHIIPFAPYDTGSAQSEPAGLREKTQVPMANAMQHEKKISRAEAKKKK